MKTLRNYVAFLDDGHDRFEFRYTSYSRAGSRANLSDCERQFKNKHGYKRTEQILWWKASVQLDSNEM